MDIRVEVYTTELKSKWDEFVELSRSSHFMFKREYIDYHNHIFRDHSLVFFNDSSNIIALLPANRYENTLYSHQGLTFGGLIVSCKLYFFEVLKVFNSMIEYLKNKRDIDCLYYKRIPDFYQCMPSQEDLYALYSVDANLVRYDVTSTICLDSQIRYSKGRKWSINKSKKYGLIIDNCERIDEFWTLLEDVINKQHKTKPTHSISEIKLLKKRFPNNILFHTISLENEVLAGSVVFQTERVAHTQYIANSNLGREYYALDLLMDHLIKDVYKNKQFFDFGISTEKDGISINDGLLGQKEGFGARTFLHETYKIDFNI